MRYKVFGQVTVDVYIEVEADSEDDAIKTAYGQRPYLTGFAGNGGTGKLIGVSRGNESVEAHREIEYLEAEDVEE
jgi:hypothetical protein